MRYRVIALTAMCVALVAAGTSSAGEPKENAAEIKALQANAADFVAAFDKGDAAALAKFFTPEGDYVDPTGRAIKGRKEIEKAFQKTFAERKGSKLNITVTSLRLVKADLAIEDGTTEISSADGGPPTVARYTAIRVKHDGQWYLESVRESLAHPPSNFEHLENLEWLAGDWEDETDKGPSAKFSYAWSENQNFLTGSFATTLNNIPVAGGTQWIGWDAAARQIRSWTFDSSGGFGEGVWSSDGDKWTIKTTITTRDGKKVTATNIVTKVDADHFTWQSTKRTVDGKAVPNTDLVKLKRIKEK